MDKEGDETETEENDGYDHVVDYITLRHKHVRSSRTRKMKEGEGIVT